MIDRFFLVFKVSNQIVRPMIIVKMAQMTVMYPWNFSHPLVIGITIAGTEIKNVTKTKTALPIAACSGHVFNNKSLATFDSVGVSPISACVVKAKRIKRPPHTTKSMSIRTYVRRMLSLILATVD